MLSVFLFCFVFLASSDNELGSILAESCVLPSVDGASNLSSSFKAFVMLL